MWSRGQRERKGRRLGSGWLAILGQFIAHDVTADRSALVDRADIEALTNVRRQKLNLEFLYGSGPAGEPYLYDVNDPAKLLIGLNDAGQAEDLQRNAQGIAIIIDPRNDSHLLMAQMQVLFSKLHNRIVDWLQPSDWSSGTTSGSSCGSFSPS